MKPLLDAIERLQAPGHLCTVYRNQEEQFASAIPFIHFGLERGERCVYIAEDESRLQPVLSRMASAGITVDDQIRSGALILATKQWAYLREGHFDPSQILAFWKEQKVAALRDGYTGLRGTAEMDWVMHGGPGVERWMEYESLLTNTLAETGCLALCQYDQRVCSPTVILNGIRTHPIVICGHDPCENFYFVPPEEFLAPDFTAHEVERRLRNLREREKTVCELKLFRTLIDRSNDAIEVVDPTTLRLLDVNEKACLELGYTREELLNLSIFDIDTAIDLHSTVKVQDDLQKTGYLIVESVHRRKDGTTFPVEVNLRWVRLERDYIVNVVRDITERKRMEAILLEREAHYRDLVEHSCDLICTHDLEGHLLSLNEVPCRILGYSREELLGTPMRDFIPPESRYLFDEYVAKIQRDGAAEGLLVVVTKSGERRIWEYHNTLRTEGVSKPIVRGIAHDVTEQKRIERALRSSEEKFSKAFRSSPVDMAIVTLAEGRIVDVNDSFERQTGYTREESIGRTCLELGVCVDADEKRDIARELKTNGRVRDREVELHSRSGEVRIALYSAEPIEIGGKACVLVVCEDVTQRKVAEKKLQLSEEKFAKAFRASPSVISISALSDGRFIEVNEAFERQSGYRREEVIGRSDTDVGIFVDVEQRDRLRALIGEGGGVRNQEVAFRTRSGQTRIISVSAEIIELEGQRCVLAVGQDITALKQAEDQLRRLTARMMGLQEEERRRIARELHDSTAQQLTGLRMGLGVLKRSAKKLDRRALLALAECRELAEQCAREIRTISYLLHPPLLDEFGLVFALRGYIQGFSNRSGLRVKLEADACLEQTRLPREIETNLFRIVQEGLTNIKHHSGSPSAVIHLKRRNGEIAVNICDKGRGMGPAVAKAIEKGDVSALGVGLSGMHERVRQLGGQFKVETSEGGTILAVTLPLEEISVGTDRPISMAARKSG